MKASRFLYVITCGTNNIIELEFNNSSTYDKNELIDGLSYVKLSQPHYDKITVCNVIIISFDEGCQNR